MRIWIQELTLSRNSWQLPSRKSTTQCRSLRILFLRWPEPGVSRLLHHIFPPFQHKRNSESPPRSLEWNFPIAALIYKWGTLVVLELSISKEMALNERANFLNFDTNFHSTALR